MSKKHTRVIVKNVMIVMLLAKHRKDSKLISYKCIQIMCWMVFSYKIIL